MLYRKAVFSLLVINVILVALQLALVEIRARMPAEVLLLYLVLAAALAAIAYFVWKGDKAGYLLSLCASVLLLLFNAASLFSVGSLPCCQLESGSIALAGIIINMVLAPFSWVSQK